MILKNILSLFFILLFLSCNRNSSQEKVNPKEYKQSLLNANKIVVSNEDEDINSYVSRHQWQMQESGTGLRYMIYQKGKGKQLQKGDIVNLTYTVELINGVKADEGTKEFEVGHGGVESGIEEAMLLLKVGDKAKLILPPHLAFGLLGDENKIPKRAVLIYDIEVQSVKCNS